MTKKNTTPVVDAIGTMDFSGNLTPHSWYKSPCFKTASGTPCLLAIAILSDIVYWYRPTIIRDEYTNEVLEVKKKFTAEKLHKTYKSWAEFYGYSRRSVQEACYLLKRNGLIDITRDNIHATNGTALNNLTYFEPVVKNIKIINTFDFDEHEKLINSVPVSPLESDSTAGCALPNSGLCASEHPAGRKRAPRCETNTEITHETTTEITQIHSTSQKFGAMILPETFENGKEATNDILYEISTPQDSFVDSNPSAVLSEEPFFLCQLTGDHMREMYKDMPAITVSEALAISNSILAESKEKKSSAKRKESNKSPLAQKRDIVKAKMEDPAYISFVEGLRTGYDLGKVTNKYILNFGKHKVQFFKTLAYRLAMEQITENDIEKSFGKMSTTPDFSIMDFLGSMINPSYSEKEILLDFITIQNDNVVNWNLEKKAIKELLQMIEHDETSLKEIEDAFLWMMSHSKMTFKSSLESLKQSGLSHYRVYTEKVSSGAVNANGGHSGNGNQAEKTLEVLSSRNYTEIAQNAMSDQLVQKMAKMRKKNERHS